MLVPYKTVGSPTDHSQAASDDILHIQSQNRGLQVQTQNQRALHDEIQSLIGGAGMKREGAGSMTKEGSSTLKTMAHAYL